MQTKKDIINILKDKNITPSYNRIKIYEYLSKDKIHPTVDDIFVNLIDVLPTLSKTTVYNTLKLFVEKKLIKAINIYDNKMRYELIRSEHGHLKCNICSEIYDIPIDMNIKLPDKLKDTIIDDYHCILVGTCPNCVKK